MDNEGAVKDRPLVLYHGDCTDGFAAAWAAYCKWRDNADYLPCVYGKTMPEVAGRRVFIFDFSFPREQLLQMKRDAATLVLLDHHKTAFAAVGDLPFCVFDMERSGAKLAWDYLHPDKPAPWIILYVQDRDLWRHELRETREVNASIGSWPHDFAFWNARWHDAQAHAVDEGAAILRYQAGVIQQHVARARIVRFHDYDVPVVNVSVLVSEILHELDEHYAFALGWYQMQDGSYVYSLRSRGGFDVSAIAKLHGGGGHRNAAGFRDVNLLV
jgi:uncharacterized protein